MGTHSDNSAATGPSTAMTTALRRILRPLVKLLISHQVTLPYLANLLKSLYVEVADQEFPVEGKKQTDSRISLLTGVHRKDVKRLRGEPAEKTAMPTSISLGSQLVARWLGDRTFHDARGRPLPLPLRARQPDSRPTFDDLVEEIARQDIRPRVVLDELLRLGIATEGEDGVVQLTTGAFTPSAGLDEKFFFFGKNLQDHICAGAHNLSGKTPAFFDRSVYYDELSEESIQSLTELCNTLGMQTLITVNEKALELQTRDRTRSGPRYRMNFGIFNYNTEFSAQADNNDEE